MEPNVVIFLAVVVSLSPIIYWLMWREDFEGMRSEWQFNRECKRRDRLTSGEFFDHFYGASGVPKDVIARLLELHARIWGVDSELIRPQDNYPQITGHFVDAESTFLAFAMEFGIEIPGTDVSRISGTFDSFARYLSERLKSTA